MTQQIEHSTEFDMFKMFSFNCEIKPKKLRKLKESIQKENLLHLHPIIVDDKYNIIDGQHRFTCARDLNVPIYYVQSENVSHFHVIPWNSKLNTYHVKRFTKKIISTA